jgi:hypothetical protein
MKEDYRRWKDSPTLMDGQNQYCENGYITKSNLKVQYNSHQNSNDIQHRDWKTKHKVHLEAKKTSNNKGNTEQKEQHFMYHNTWH